MSACSTSTAFDARRASSVTPRLVRDGHALEPPARLEDVAARVEQGRELAAPGLVARAPGTGRGDGARAFASRPLGGAEAGFEVGQDVVEGLDADAQPDEVGRDAGRRLLVLR